MRSAPFRDLLHPHHQLYLPLMRWVYPTGWFPDAFKLMVGADVLLSAATIGLCYGLTRSGLNLNRRASLFTCGFLAVSYGFWRYAVATEIYALTSFATALLAWAAFAPASVVSPNYLFSLPGFSAWIERLMPYRNLAEENFMARSFSPVLGGFCLVLTAGLFVLLVHVAVRRLDWSQPRRAALFRDRKAVTVLAWLLGYIAVVLAIEPENPEMWVCGLLPIALCAGFLLHHLHRGATYPLPWLFLIGLFTQNLFGGMMILHSPSSDYNADKARWVLAHTGKDDLVFTRDNGVFSRYLGYYSPSRIINCYQLDAEATRQILATAPASAGQRYLFTDVLVPPGYHHVKFPDQAPGLVRLARELGPTLAPTEAADVKRLAPAASASSPPHPLSKQTDGEERIIHQVAPAQPTRLLPEPE